MAYVKFVQVENEKEIEILANKADIIWHEYFPTIISVEQIDYMVDMFLSIHAIKREIEEGYLFYLAYDGEALIGFTVLRPEEDRLFISKLYVDKEHRGQGFGSPMFEKAKEVAVKHGLHAMYLTVNKYNTPSIEIYLHKGFETIEEVETDIGSGFVMDDYVMEYKLNKRDIAMANFKLGYNCSQAVVLAFLDELEMEQEMAARIASSFGGGMGRLREVCGAVSGMFLVAGAFYGYDNPDAYEQKAEHYARIQYLAEAFKKRNQSIVCRELLGVQTTDGHVPEKRTDEFYRKRPCIHMIGDAAEILEQYIVTVQSHANFHKNK